MILDRTLDYVIFGWLLVLSFAWFGHGRWDRREFREIKRLLNEIKAELKRGET